MKDALSNDTNGDRTALLALTGSGAAWLIHLLAVYAIAEWGCVAGPPRVVAGLSTLSWMTIAVTVLTLALTLWNTMRARTVWRSQGQLPLGVTERYLAGAAFVTSAVFALIIAVEAMPILFFLSEC